MVLSKVEGLTTLSQVEGQISKRGASACAVRDRNSKFKTDGVTAI